MATVSLDRERLAAALPDVTTDQRLAGLDGQVRVFRDMEEARLWLGFETP